MYARRPADPDGNVDYTGPTAAEDAYERAKQAEQDALAAQTALVKISLQAQRDFERAKQAEQGALAAQAALAKTSLQAQTDMEAAKKANNDAYERAKQAEQDALVAQAALAKTSLQAQTYTEANKKANEDAYERAKQAEQDALAARTALVETSMQAQEEAKATQIQHEQQRQDAIEQQRQETQRAAQLFRFGASEWRGAGGGEEEGGRFSVRSLKAKNMEDRLSPKAQDQVKKSAKVKSGISDKIAEDRKRALFSAERRRRGFTEGLRVDTEAQQQRSTSADEHAREMDTMDEIKADLIREVQEVHYKFPSPH